MTTSVDGGGTWATRSSHRRGVLEAFSRNDKRGILEAFRKHVAGGLKVLALLLATMAALTFTITETGHAGAATKQPMDLQVKCGASITSDTDSITRYYASPSCTAIVTYNDLSSASATLDGENWSGATNVIQQGANGYLAKTDCTQPAIGVATYINGAIPSVCLTASLKSKPVVPQTASAVQVPTTGAPSSDLILPASILALGGIGVSLVLTRRRA